MDPELIKPWRTQIARPFPLSIAARVHVGGFRNETQQELLSHVCCLAWLQSTTAGQGMIRKILSPNSATEESLLISIRVTAVITRTQRTASRQEMT
jgi:hypothetical protein